MPTRAGALRAMIALEDSAAWLLPATGAGRFGPGARASPPRGQESSVVHGLSAVHGLADGRAREWGRAGSPAALLNTVAVSATDVHQHSRRRAALTARATVHGHTVAFSWSAVIFAVGAVMCGVLLRAAPAAPRPRTKHDSHRATAAAAGPLGRRAQRAAITDRFCRAASYSGHAYSRFDERDGYVKIVLDPAARSRARPPDA